MREPRTTVICPVWHGDPGREALLRGHLANLDALATAVERVYVFDGGDRPPGWLKGTTVCVSVPLTSLEAYNAALVMVRTPYVVNLNLDDRFAPDGVAELEAALDAGADLAGGDWRICYTQAETDAVERCAPAESVPFVAAWPPAPGTVTRLGSGTGERGTYGPANLYRMALHAQVARYPWRFGDRTPMRAIGDLVWWSLLRQLGKRLVRKPVIIGRYHSHPATQAEFRHPHAPELERLAKVGIAMV